MFERGQERGEFGAYVEKRVRLAVFDGYLFRLRAASNRNVSAIIAAGSALRRSAEDLDSNWVMVLTIKR